MILFDKYSFHQKKLGLLVLFVLLLAVSYKRVFKTTFETIKSHAELLEKHDQAQNSSETLRKKQKEITIINSFIGKENVPNEKVQQGFLNLVSTKNNAIRIERMEEVYTFNHPDFVINTNQITLQGGFIDLIYFLYELENSFNLARLVSVHYFKKKEKNSERETLFSTILLQNFSKK